MISSEDLPKLKAFHNIVKAGSFDIKGEAVIQAALLFKWYEDFIGRVEVTLTKPKPKKKAPRGNKVEVNANK